ncbi:unnamed protein product [Symbiodinium natans]|uniref:Uncharacterized protein n=1 Tax=Symbiodinium natans TaxID=878477 RepID=A0A812P9V2_9DINO|nr:unnamed protein product [Symbiodinium natans]
MAEEEERSPNEPHEPIDEDDDDAAGTIQEIMDTPTPRRSRTRTRSPVAERSSSAKESGSVAKANDSGTVAIAKAGTEATASGPPVLPKSMASMGAIPGKPAGPPPPTPANPPCMGGGGRPPLAVGGPPPPTPVKTASMVLQQGIYTVVWDPNTCEYPGGMGLISQCLCLQL